MKRSVRVGAVLVGTLMLSSLCMARDLGVLVQPIHQGKFTSSLLYEDLRVKDDFDSRGRAVFTGQVTGAQFTYGVTDQIALSLKGGTIIDPQVEAQGSRWESRAGYLYGMDLYNEVFPATPGGIPGIQVSAGVTGFQVPLDRTNLSSATWQTVDQKMSGFEYHAAVLATFRVGIAEPYAGLRGFGSTVNWQDNNAVAPAPDHITGHAHGNISVVVGLPLQIMKEVRFQLEGRFVSETAITAGFTIAAF